MVIIIVENVSLSLKGLMSRWMIEPKSGVFVGTLNARVREKVWEKVISETSAKGACLMVYSTNNEQGFAMKSYGDFSREIVEIQGLYLIKQHITEKKAKRKRGK